MEVGRKIRVLIHCPIGFWQPKSYESIMNLDTSDLEVDIFFTVSNPIDPSYNMKGIETNPRWRYNIAYKMNKAREIVLNEDYDYLFNVEHDMIIPENALKKLIDYIDYNTVVGGLYRCRKIRNPKNPLCFHIKLPDGRGVWVDDNYIEGKEKIEVYVIPFGCTLIGREVLEQVEFDPGIDGTFASKTDNLGIKKYIITSVICGHIDRDGIIYYP